MKLPSWVHRDPQASLKSILGEDYELPSFPAVIAHSLDVVRDDDASSAEIAAVVASDPATSVRLLSTINSAAYAVRQRVDSVQQAVNLLGRNELESLLIAGAVGRILPDTPAKGFTPRRFWETASRRAALARSLAELVEPSIRSQCFTAALLQDMAVPVLAHHHDSAYGDLLQAWHEEGDDLARMERERYEWDHALAATWLCERWDLPASISAAIGAHHGTGEAGARALGPVNVVAGIGELGMASDIERLVALSESELNIGADVTLRVVSECFDAIESDSSMSS